MHDEHELLPLVDSCRADAAGPPDAEDLAAAVAADPALRPSADKLAHDPAAQALFARAQQLDRKIQSAMTNIAVPADLAARILSRLAGNDNTLEVAIIAPAVITTEVPQVSLGHRLGRTVWHRRYWLATGLATAAGLLLFVNWYASAIPYSPGMILEAAREFDAAAPHEPGSSLAESRPSQHYAVSNRIVTSAESRWRIVANFLGRKAVAYDLQTPAGVKATLYVARLGGLPTAPQIDAHLLPTAPPRKPQPASGGDSMATWQEHGRLYVLVVHGDANAYQQLIRPESEIARLSLAEQRRTSPSPRDQRRLTS